MDKRPDDWRDIAGKFEEEDASDHMLSVDTLFIMAQEFACAGCGVDTTAAWREREFDAAPACIAADPPQRPGGPRRSSRRDDTEELENLDDVADKVTDHATMNAVRTALTSVGAHRNPRREVWEAKPDGDAGNSAEEQPRSFFAMAGGAGNAVIIAVTFERFSTRYATANNVKEAKVAGEKLQWTVVYNRSFLRQLGGRQASAHAEMEKPSPPQRVKDALTRVPEHVRGDAELMSRLVSLVLGVFGPEGMGEARTALAVVFPDADELEAEIQTAEAVAEATSVEKMVTEVEELTDRPLHGHAKQPGLTGSIIAQLLAGGPTAVSAWMRVDNLGDCLKAYEASLTKAQHNTAAKLRGLITEFETLKKAGQGPLPALKLKEIAQLCAKGAASIIVGQAVVYREVVPARDGSGGGEAAGGGGAAAERLRKLAEAKTLYEFLGLPANEIAGPDQLFLHLQKLRENEDYAMKDVRASTSDKKVILRKVSAAGRILSLPYRDAFLIYEEVHRAALQEGNEFAFSFAENVTAQTIIVEAALYRINLLGLFRNEHDVVFRKEKGGHAYECVCKLEEVVDFVFSPPAHPKQQQEDAYCECRRWVAANKFRKGAEAGAVSSPLVEGIMAKWPCTELSREWYSCPGGMYNVNKDKFYPTGTQEYNDLVARGVTAFMHFPDAKCTGGDDTETPNFDKVFDAQDYSEQEKLVCMGLCLGRLLHPVKSKDNWQVTGFLKGHGGTGKSVILDVARSFFPVNVVADLGEGKGNVGQYTNIIGKYLVLIPETSHNFGPGGFRDTWCKMVEGATITVARCGMADWQGVFAGYLLHAGNEWFGWADPQGAVKRRGVPFPYKKVLDRKVDTKLAVKIKPETMKILIKANRAYLRLVELVGDMGFFHALATVPEMKCERIVKLSNQLSSDRNMILQFLTDEHFVRPDDDPDAGIDFNSFNESFSRWMTKYRAGAIKKNVTFDLLESQVSAIAAEMKRPTIKAESSSRVLKFGKVESKQGIRGLQLTEDGMKALGMWWPQKEVAAPY